MLDAGMPYLQLFAAQGKNGNTVLPGCGTGNYIVILSEYVGKVTGVEVNEKMLGIAMEKTATLKNVSLTQGDITKMPFQDNQFDAICCNLVSVAINNGIICAYKLLLAC